MTKRTTKTPADTAQPSRPPGAELTHAQLAQAEGGFSFVKKVDKPSPQL